MGSSSSKIQTIAGAVRADELPYVTGRRYRLTGTPFPEDNVQTATANRLYILPPKRIKQSATFTKIEIEESASGGAGASGSARIGLMNWSTLALIQDIGQITTFAGAGAIRSSTGNTIAVTAGQVVSVLVACSAAIKAIGERTNNTNDFMGANSAYFAEVGLASWSTSLAWYNSADLWKPGMMTHVYGALPNPIVPAATGDFCPIVAFSF